MFKKYFNARGVVSVIVLGSLLILSPSHVGAYETSTPSSSPSILSIPSISTNIKNSISISSSSFGLTKFFNLGGFSTNDLGSSVKAIAVLVLNIFQAILGVLTTIVKVVLGFLKL